jgi:serine acetyltransferase/thymidylate kinase
MDERAYVAQALFHRLAERGIEFTVLGDAEKIPEALTSDLDMAVSPADLRDMPETMAGFCHDFGLRLVQLIRHERSACYFVIAWLDAVGGLCFLAPDFCSDYRRAGRLILRSEELLAAPVEALDAEGAPRGFPVPPPDIQFVYYLAKKIDKLDLDDAQGDYLARQWQADPDAALRRMVRFWPELTDNGLIARAASTNDWTGVRAQLPRLRRALHRAIGLSPFDALAEAVRLAGRALRPTGLTIAFAGPDGSGKSSLIERTVLQLAPAFRRAQVLHLRPRVIGGRRGAAPVVDPYAAPPRSPAASVAKLALLVADYVVGYALKVRPFATRSGLVVFDRYYQDLLADPRRFRYGGPMALARAAARLIPQPDLWIVLDASAQTLQARKQEVTPEESEAQRRAYLALATQVNDAVLVDANQSPTLMAAAAAQAILMRMENRVERRHIPLRHENPWSARVLLFFARFRIPLISRLVAFLFHSDLRCRIRSPILMPHPFGIVVHAYAQVGNRVTLMQQVAIGPREPDETAAPVIGDEVFVGAGARILGGVRVGRGAIIGANAVVTRDVPSYCTVVGVNRILGRHERAANEAQALLEGEPAPRRAIAGES